MRAETWITTAPEVADALAEGRPVVALESTLIVHGLPWPINVETALEAEAAIRARGAVPATIAVLNGEPIVGVRPEEIAFRARRDVIGKAGRRDLAAAIALRKTVATTVSATMTLASLVGIRVFATGGIGGAHAEPAPLFDISADLTELARTAMIVVSAGAKSILDLPRTLELLETLSVPVVGWQTDEFPAFVVRSSGLPVSVRVETAREAAMLYTAHVRLGGRGVLLCRPCDEGAMTAEEFAAADRRAAAEALASGVHGAALTPFLLHRIAELTDGRSLSANRSLIVANAGLAAETARELVPQPVVGGIRR